MNFEVTILGCGAATPTARHNPSAQVVNVHDKLFLIDCGEGTQMRLREEKFRVQRINHIFISHLHGDHCLGLVGLICSQHLLGRKGPLHLYGPPDLKEWIELSLKVSQTYLDFPLEFHANSFDGKNLIMEDKSIEVYSFPLKHRIECCGYQFVEKPRLPRIEKSSILEFDLQPSHIIALKHNQEVTLSNGTVLTPEQVCIDVAPVRSYSYCSDTMYWETLIPSIKGSNLLYHESTFLESEKERAKTTFHSTAKQAARIAAQAEVKQLLLGHFSSRYGDERQFVEEASEFFKNCTVAFEGLTIHVPY
jgi:ribonuclease Z